VIGKLKDDDVSWIARELPDLETAIYVVDDPQAPLHVPRNKGREAMVYLTYIIDHYDRLPDTVLFFHPHQVTWHNNILLGLNTATTIQRLSDARVAREGYFNSRCHHDPGCPNWLHIDRPEAEWDTFRKNEERFFTSSVWRELHPSAPVPSAISQPCCAQFAVSGARIKSRPQSEYIRYRDWLLTTELEDEISGRIMEYTWQYIFTDESEFCPPMNACYCDGYGICFGGGDELQNWLNILRRREILDEEFDRLSKDGTSGGDEGQRNRDEAFELNSQLDALKEEAYHRGDDPRNRALEGGRAWREGDGF